MNHFNCLPSFDKELEKLIKKYPTLDQDINELEKVLNKIPTGSGKNFTIIHSEENIKIVKVRLACKSLKNRSMRIIFSYCKNTLTFMYIEIYFKGDKENEDRERIKEYLNSCK